MHIARAATTGEEASAVNNHDRSWIAELVQFERAADVFTVSSPTSGYGRLFGGLIAAQGLAAAAATVEDRKLPQSLHAYFVRSGTPGVDVVLEVERTRDGRSFDTRRVTVRQADAIILEMLASFHVVEDGVDEHPAAPPTVPLAESTVARQLPGLDDRFEMRVVGDGEGWTGPPYWVRSRQPIEDDRVIEACALTFMSDMGLMATARPPGRPVVLGEFVAASLDHAIWFHRPFSPERWHSFQADRLNFNDSCGLVAGAFYDEAGSLIASIQQEALWRS
ncbi:MAG: acyl-CoA thioesterase domain-containing protein [Acidimicrobiales bacterium]